MSLSKISSGELQVVNTRLQKAQANRSFTISTELFSQELVKLIHAHLNAIGVPPEFILWPLLTTTASLMGTNASIKINDEWFEPSIIWFVIAARERRKQLPSNASESPLKNCKRSFMTSGKMMRPKRSQVSHHNSLLITSVLKNFT